MFRFSYGLVLLRVWVLLITILVVCLVWYLACGLRVFDIDLMTAFAVWLVVVMIFDSGVSCSGCLVCVYCCVLLSLFGWFVYWFWLGWMLLLVCFVDFVFCVCTLFTFCVVVLGWELCCGSYVLRRLNRWVDWLLFVALNRLLHFTFAWFAVYVVCAGCFWVFLFVWLLVCWWLVCVDCG